LLDELVTALPVLRTYDQQFSTSCTACRCEQSRTDGYIRLLASLLTKQLVWVSFADTSCLLGINHKHLTSPVAKLQFFCPAGALGQQYMPIKLKFSTEKYTMHSLSHATLLVCWHGHITNFGTTRLAVHTVSSFCFRKLTSSCTFCCTTRYSITASRISAISSTVLFLTFWLSAILKRRWKNVCRPLGTSMSTSSSSSSGNCRCCCCCCGGLWPMRPRNLCRAFVDKLSLVTGWAYVPPALKITAVSQHNISLWQNNLSKKQPI